MKFYACLYLPMLLCATALAAAQGVTTAAKPVDPTFDRWCVHCHGAGIYMAGTLGLQLKYQGTKPALLQERTDLTPEIVKTFVRHGSKSMPPFRKTEVSDAELEALAEYLSKH